MSPVEWANIQEAIVFIFSPWVILYLGVFVGVSIMTAVFLMFASLAKYLTRMED